MLFGAPPYSSFQLSRVSAITPSDGRGVSSVLPLAAGKTLANSQAPESESIAGCTRTHWSRSVVFLASSQCCAAAGEK